MPLKATGVAYAFTPEDEARAKAHREGGYEEKKSYTVAPVLPDCALCLEAAARCGHNSHQIYSATRGEDGWPQYIRHISPDVPFEVYTDGSGTTRTRPAGAGAVLVRAGVVLAEARKGFAFGTNNLAECRALHLGLWLLRAHARSLGAEGHGAAAVLYSDSEWALEATSPTCDWSLKAKEKDGSPKGSTIAALAARELRAKMPRVEFKWLKGHAGHVFNERADVLAGEARRSMLSTIDAHSIK